MDTLCRVDDLRDIAVRSGREVRESLCPGHADTGLETLVRTYVGALEGDETLANDASTRYSVVVTPHE